MLSRNEKPRIYRTIISPVVLYGCESWSLKLREEHRVKVFENRMLRRMFGSKRGEVTRGWRKLHHKLHHLYPSPNIIRTDNQIKDETGEACSAQWRDEKAYKTLVVKPEGRDHSEDVGVGGRTILKWILGKEDGWECTGFI
jgi:hypothetical protein